jgi:hypothetical protein
MKKRGIMADPIPIRYSLLDVNTPSPSHVYKVIGQSRHGCSEQYQRCGSCRTPYERGGPWGMPTNDWLRAHPEDNGHWRSDYYIQGFGPSRLPEPVAESVSDAREILRKMRGY